MNLTKKLTVLLTILILASMVFGCGVKEKVAQGQEIKVNKIPIETTLVSKGDFTKSLLISGTTNPNSIVNVTPKIAGAEKIIALNIKEGDQVTTGQTIARLDQSTVVIQLNQAQKNYDDALRNYERNKVLFEAGAIPQANFEQIETALQQTQSALDGQKIAFNNTIIKAPISGIVTAVNVEEGTLASAQSLIATIVDISKLEINSSINENKINKITLGQEVNILIPSAGEKVYQGKIAYISPMMDERAKTYPIKIAIDNSKNEIKAGMYAKVELVTDVRKDTIKVPRKAVITRDGENRIFVIEEDKAVLKQVEVGLNNGQEIEVTAGLEVGEEIVITGNEDLVNGDLVTVTNRGDSK